MLVSILVAYIISLLITLLDYKTGFVSAEKDSREARI